MLFKCGIEPSRVEESKSNKCRITDDDAVVIGDTKVQRYQTADSAKVPNVLFYDLPQVGKTRFVDLFRCFLRTDL